MRIFYSDRFELPLPPGHRFPMAKYRLLRQAVEREGLVPPADLHVAEPATDEELSRVHDAAYVERVKSGTLAPEEVRALGFPWSPELVERSRRSVGATIAACRAARADGCGVNLAGGTHHAFAARGGGFCVFNDVAVAARAMQAEGLARRILVVDCDVHQGDGTAAIFAGDETVFTLSIHGARNYPLRKQKSDLDLPLPDGAGDRQYLDALERGLDVAFASGHFDLAVYLAGADPFEADRLGRLAVTAEGLAGRDRMVFEACRARALPVAVVMAGGYPRAVEAVVELHLRTVALAARLYARADLARSPKV